MTGTRNGLQGGGAADRSPRTVITSAQFATSTGQASRQRRYAITMAFRTACFVSMIFVSGPLRWVLFACAVFLPYVAVLFANQADTRAGRTAVQHVAPPALQLGVGGPAPEIIHGTVVEPPVYGEHATDGREQEDRDRAAVDEGERRSA